ncbi:hypothetical protein K438DRAFT_1863791 [Mycena galopus ATCC 62051]|nr:hypothetical protein K438DRAFT_1863791 [Mycena galopus ATCC 62051]
MQGDRACATASQVRVGVGGYGENEESSRCCRTRFAFGSGTRCIRRRRRGGGGGTLPDTTRRPTHLYSTDPDLRMTGGIDACDHIHLAREGGRRATVSHGPWTVRAVVDVRVARIRSRRCYRTRFAFGSGTRCIRRRRRRGALPDTTRRPTHLYSTDPDLRMTGGICSRRSAGARNEVRRVSLSLSIPAVYILASLSCGRALHNGSHRILALSLA